MTSSHDFERNLGAWLRQDSEHRVPDHLDAVLVRTIATRQRPWWSSLRRWLPDVTLPPAPLSRSGSWRPILVLAAVVLLIAALVLFAVGSRRHVPAPFGLARNGAIVTAVAGDLFQVDLTTGVKTPLLSDSQAHADFAPGFSRDGTKLSYLRNISGGQQLFVATPDGSDAHAVTPVMGEGIDQADWSPDGSRLVVLARAQGVGQIHVVTTDRSGLDTRVVLPFSANQVSWLPPDGNAILFRGEQLAPGDAPPAIYTIRPDGTGLHRISSRPAADDNDLNDVSASPDGTSILYRESPVTGAFVIHVLDVRTGKDSILPSPATAAGQTSPVFSPDGVHVAYLRLALDSAQRLTFQLVVAPLDGTTVGTGLPLFGVAGDDGPTINNYFFTPDGSAVVANELTTVTEWLLPIDGSRGKVIARGTAPYDAMTSVQRLAP